MDSIKRFRTITLRPHWAQYFISQGMLFIITLLLLLAAGWEGIPIRFPFIVCACVIGLVLLYRYLYINTLKYIISSEQLIIEHGVFRRKNDYIELYRVVDYEVNRSLTEQLFGLKTVSIYSGDRTSPRLDILGVKENLDVVSIIRERVEWNRQIKHIYEVTNR